MQSISITRILTMVYGAMLSFSVLSISYLQNRGL
ncbi:MAG: hypothetical protein JWM56_1174 [Candidatus Peribacteria bacterium]|nr:hypothetical protein [Candidatus Peribacteria bacterium]